MLRKLPAGCARLCVAAQRIVPGPAVALGKFRGFCLVSLYLSIGM